MIQVCATRFFVSTCKQGYYWTSNVNKLLLDALDGDNVHRSSDFKTTLRSGMMFVNLNEWLMRYLTREIQGTYSSYFDSLVNFMCSGEKVIDDFACGPVYLPISLIIGFGEHSVSPFYSLGVRFPFTAVSRLLGHGVSWGHCGGHVEGLPCRIVFEGEEKCSTEDGKLALACEARADIWELECEEFAGGATISIVDYIQIISKLRRFLNFRSTRWEPWQFRS